MNSKIKNSTIAFVYALLIINCNSEIWAQILKNNLPFFSGRNTQNGFLAYEVNGVASDSLGMVWMATNLGLYRYDGIHFIDFTHLLANKNQTQSNYISTVYSDSRKNIWVAHENALVCINGNNLNFKNFIHNQQKINSAPNGMAFRIIEYEGNIWTCNGSPELSSLNKKTGSFTHYDIRRFLKEPKRDLSIRDFWIASDTEIWIATRSEMIRFNLNKEEAISYQILNDNGKRNPGLITRICRDPNSADIIWIGTWGKGLVKFHTKTGECKYYLYEVNLAENISNIIFDVIPKNNQTLWAGGNGLIEFDIRTEKFRIHKNDPSRKSSLNVNEIRSLYKDPKDRFWLGTVDGFSLYTSDKNQISLHKLPIKTSIGQFIYEPKTESIYFVNYFANRKLYRFNRDLELKGSWSLPKADALFSEPFGFCSDLDGRIWIATTHSGLLYFDPSTSQMKAVNWEKGSKNTMDLNSTTMRCDSAGIIWIGTLSNGLLRCNTKNPIIKAVRQIKHRVDGLIISSNGILWIQEDRNRLHRLNTKTYEIKTFGGNNDQNEKLIKSISDICKGSQGKIFISTLKNGILEVNGENIRRVNGLENLQNIHSIFADSSNNLWMISPNKLIRYDYRSKKIQNFSSANGLTGNLANSSFNIVSNNEVWIPTGEGIFSVQTNLTPNRKVKYELILNSIKIFDKEITNSKNFSLNDGITLKHSENYITFEFQAIAFNQQEDLQYAYMLEGLDRNWIESGNRHFASYQALSPGNYRFKVKVSDGINEWSSNELNIIVKIVPAWWQTLIFKVFILILILIIITIIIRNLATRKLRKRLQLYEQQQEIEKIRNRIARDIHDEIGSGLSKIALLSDGLERKLKNDQDLLKTSQRVRQLSKEVIKSMGEIIWAINPGNDDISSLISYVRGYLNQFQEESNIIVKSKLLTENLSLSKSRIRPEIKRNLLMIMKESLTNVLKHSNANEVQFQLLVNMTSIQLIVHDNGNGMNGSPNFNQGNGIKNMQKRASELNGTLNFNESNGFCLDLKFPFTPQWQ